MFLPEDFNTFLPKIEEAFMVLDTKFDQTSVYFQVQPKYSHERSFNIVLNNFKNTEFVPLYRKFKDGYNLIITHRRRRQVEVKPIGHIILLLLTAVTVTWAGYEWWADHKILESMMFAVALMSILGIHELGHALTARTREIESTLPFFIPAPPYIFPLGTFGAVIFMGSPAQSRNSLLDVGIAGPLVGFFLSIPITLVGLSMSHIIPLEEALKEGGIIFSPSIMFQILTQMIFGKLPETAAISIHPIAVAGWVGMFVTSLNLLPMGQLDGGHIIRGLFPRHYRKIYRLTAFILLLIGLLWPGWILWTIIVFLMTRLEHPGPLNDVSELDLRGKLYGVMGIIILILCFTPVPIIPVEIISQT
jgi:Zn-dependent protease